MSVWFTSDLHLGHRKVAEHRGFTGPDAVAEHDAALAGAWVAAVAPEHSVWVLGDLAASSPTHALSVLAGLPGRKHLILGNHDRPYPMHRGAHARMAPYLAVFESVQMAARRRVNGTEVLLSHFPYRRDRDEPRYTQWRLPDEGRWLLHGHTHGDERVTVEGTTREIHVGVDAWGLNPVHLDTIAELIKDN